MCFQTQIVIIAIKVLVFLKHHTALKLATNKNASDVYTLENNIVLQIKISGKLITCIIQHNMFRDDRL